MPGVRPVGTTGGGCTGLDCEFEATGGSGARLLPVAGPERLLGCWAGVTPGVEFMGSPEDVVGLVRPDVDVEFTPLRPPIEVVFPELKFVGCCPASVPRLLRPPASG